MRLTLLNYVQCQAVLEFFGHPSVYHIFFKIINKQTKEKINKWEKVNLLLCFKCLMFISPLIYIGWLNLGTFG